MRVDQIISSEVTIQDLEDSGVPSNALCAIGKLLEVKSGDQVNLVKDTKDTDIESRMKVTAMFSAIPLPARQHDLKKSSNMLVGNYCANAPFKATLSHEHT